MKNYDKIMKEMTPERFAQIGVKPAVINGNEVFYMSSSGQLFPFTNEGLQRAVNFEYRWLMIDDESEPDKDMEASAVEE